MFVQVYLGRIMTGAIITEIPVHCTLLNIIIDIHDMQTSLPEKKVNLLVEELDNRSMGNGLNSARLLQSI